MSLWSSEIKELETLYTSIKGKFPELEKELDRLVKADDENMVLLYSRRCLEVIITDLYECELKRPRKTEPLKGIIDKLHHEEKVPANIIASMQSLNSLSTFGAHPKEFDPRQVKPVLNNLATIIEWYLKNKNIGRGHTRDHEESEITADFKIKTENSIAVLPFVDMSPQKDQEYFCDGISEEIINALAHLENLKVISRTSSFIFKNSKSDIREIGERLGVDTILEGSIRKSEDRLRITTQLIKISDGSHIWSERFDRETKDIFDIQDEISVKIVEKLKVDLTEEKGKERLQKRYTSNLEAHNLYLEGRYFFNKRNDEGIRRSIECFEKAIKKDPDYVLPYAGLADAYVFYALGYGALPPKEALPKAREAAIKAIEMDCELADAHTSLGIVLTYLSYNQAGAEKEFLKAIDLNPNHLPAHQWYAHVLGVTNRWEKALEEQKKALELDPVSIQLHTEIGWTYHYMGEFDKAIAQYRKVIDMDPDFAIVHFNLGSALSLKGLHKEAIEESQKGVTLSGGSPFMKWGLIHAYVLSGNRKPAKELLKEMIELSKSGILVAFIVALIYVSLGETKPALLWFEKSYNNREPFTSMVRVWLDKWIITDLLNSEPEYHELLKKIGQDW
jgi:adenylate cyclase